MKYYNVLAIPHYYMVVKLDKKRQKVYVGYKGRNDVLMAVNDYSMRDFIKYYYFIRESGIAENVNDIIISRHKTV